nr:G-type lectin S-receptor-like serine/threonine-protein kinase At2g19130 [Ipomoea batatas]
MYFVVFLGLCVIFNSPISLGDDTLTVNDNLSLTTTIVSSNGRFEMGFFTPGKTANYYAGIWYNQIEPQTVIWVANRDTPISFVDMASTALKILNGNLVLVNVTGGLLWSTNAATSGTSNSSLRATLLNTGNLVLIDGNSTDEAQPLWQSFDHPTDTTMAGAKFGYNKLTGEKQTLRSWKSPEDPSPGLYSLAMDPQIWQFAATWNGTDRYWTSGPANGSLFKLVPEMRANPIYNFTFVNNANQTFFVYEFFNPDAVISRFVLDISGQLRHYTWLDSSKAWNILFLKPEKQCDVPAVCGPFGMCNDNSTSLLCDCLPGFRRKSDKDWGLKVFSGGCVRKVDLQCGNATGTTANSQEDRFRMVTNTRLPRHPRNVTVGSITECESACLRNCSCNAYAYDNRNGGCSHWDGELLNLSKDNSNGSTIYIRLAASEFFVLGLCVFFNSPVSLGDETLTVNNNLSLTTPIVSSNGRFEMGFFTPGKSANYYAGIWYSKIEPQTVIWVANRDTPISFVDMQTTTLKILDGNLVLVSVTAGLIWSTNATSGASKNSVRATLLNTGNLVLIDGNTTDQPLWQSFDHPTDTIMAGAKFGYNKLTGEKQTLRSWKSPEDPSPGLYSLAMDPQIWQFAATWNGTDRYWTSGPANGSLFKFVPDMRPNPIYNFTFVNNANQTFFVYEFFNPDAVISRFVLDISGQLRHYTWLDSSKAWNILFLKPEKQCDVPAFCGPFGMCNDNSTSLCDCLPGFRRKSDKDWGLNVFTDGCVRIADLQCGNATGTANSQEDKFRMVTNTRLPRHPRNVTVGSTTECESACLRNCSCNAYAYDNRNGGCSHWDGELLNLSKDNSNGSTIYIRLAASEFFVQGT